MDGRVRVPEGLAHGMVVPHHFAQGLEDQLIRIFKLVPWRGDKLRHVLGNLGPDLANPPSYFGPFHGRHRSIPNGRCHAPATQEHLPTPLSAQAPVPKPTVETAVTRAEMQKPLPSTYVKVYVKT